MPLRSFTPGHGLRMIFFPREDGLAWRSVSRPLQGPGDVCVCSSWLVPGCSWSRQLRQTAELGFPSST